MEDGKRRLTAIGFECGKMALHVVDLQSSEPEVISTNVADLEGTTVCKVQFFQHYPKIPVPKTLKSEVSKSEKSQQPRPVNLLAITADAISMVFYNVAEFGIGRTAILPNSDEHDAVTCCLAADVDFDGKKEIILGTYGQEILVYKETEDRSSKRKWQKIWTRPFNNPVLGLLEADLTNDGVREITVVTSRSIVVLQHDLVKVSDLIDQRRKKIQEQSS